MREIKFRALAKHKDNLIWHYYGINSKPLLLGIDYEWVVEDLQFTGLLDKNGKEIYEGDVLGSEGVALEVYWSDNGYLLRSLNDKSTASALPVWSLRKERNELIGNIYENPELLNTNLNKE